MVINIIFLNINCIKFVKLFCFGGDFVVFVYPFLVSFMLIFISELGDKTQLLVLSFCTNNRIKNILLGVAIGTFFSHGMAILFGSAFGVLDNVFFNFYLKIFTYISFILLGIIGFLPERNKSNDSKCGFLQKMSNLKISCVFIVAISIFAGEIGDKTFLSSLGLGFQYPNSKFSLILGSICGMVFSNLIAIVLGKFLNSKFDKKYIKYISNLLFIIFGIIGIINFLFFYVQ